MRGEGRGARDESAGIPIGDPFVLSVATKSRGRRTLERIEPLDAYGPFDSAASL